jgi:hypothetical protein
MSNNTAAEVIPMLRLSRLVRASRHLKKCRGFRVELFPWARMIITLKKRPRIQ